MATPSAFISARVHVKLLLWSCPQKCHRRHSSVEDDDVMRTGASFCGSKGNSSRPPGNTALIKFTDCEGEKQFSQMSKSEQGVLMWHVGMKNQHEVTERMLAFCIFCHLISFWRWWISLPFHFFSYIQFSFSFFRSVSSFLPEGMFQLQSRLAGILLEK